MTSAVLHLLVRGTTHRVTEERRTLPLEDAVRVDLPEDLTAPRAARAQTRGVLADWRLSNLLEPVALVVSELVANAVRHGRPPVDMLLRRSGRSVRVEVHDEAPMTAMQPLTPALDAESGRGLAIVDEVADDAGLVQIPGDGKVAWAQFDQPDRRAPRTDTSA